MPISCRERGRRVRWPGRALVRVSAAPATAALSRGEGPRSREGKGREVRGWRVSKKRCVLDESKEKASRGNEEKAW